MVAEFMTASNRSIAARRHMRTSIGVVVLLLCCASGTSRAFVLLEPRDNDLESAIRWAARPDPAIGTAGLYDGIQVAVEPGLAEKLAMAVTGEARPEDVARAEAAVRAAFAAWENSVLRLEVTFDGPAERGENVGSEIDVFAVPESDPVFQGNDFFGVTYTDFEMVENRALTNGDVLPGFAFTGADIFLNIDMLAVVAPIFAPEDQPAALQRLLMHETGHALGFGHVNVFPAFNYDTDNDPLNAMEIDPRNPLANLMLSSNVDVNAVMSNLPNTLDALVLTALTNDEVGGRDALYPGPPLTDCAADCDADGTVSIEELLRAVQIGVGDAYFLVCPAADRDRDLRVTIDELIGGVNAALAGCASERH
jgi:hypothetical protein